MSTSPNNRDGKPVPPKPSTVILLLSTIGDTTWRMFVPTIGLTVLGVYIDKSINTLPWCTLAGIAVGSVIAGMLIRRQLKKVQE